MAKKINHSIKLTPEVETAFVGFKPRFGSDLDIAIINELGDLKNLLTLEEASRARRKELNKIEKDKSKRREAIEKMQVHLLWQMSVRAKELSTESTDL